MLTRWRVKHDPTRLPTAAERGQPPPYMFAPLSEQLANVKRWNEDREWGLDTATMDSIDLTPHDHSDPLVVNLIAVYAVYAVPLPRTRRFWPPLRSSHDGPGRWTGRACPSPGWAATR